MVSFISQQSFTYLVVIFMLTNIIINYSMRDDLFKLGINLIYQFQQAENHLLNVFFYIITLLIDPAAVLVITFALIIINKNKYNAFVSVIFILLNTYLAGVLKAFYADPRPFWAHQKIKNIGIYCPQQYGNPSGHSWFSVILTFSVLIQYFGTGKKLFNLYASIAIIILVPTSRMYLGAHSLNQVFQGLFLGFSMIILYKFSGLKIQIQSFLKNFNSQPRLRWKKVILLMHVCYILSYLINEENINPYYKRIQQIWVENILNKCNKQVNTNKLNFMMLMINSILVNISTGIAMGYERLVKSQKGRIYLSGKWIINEQRNSKFIGQFYYYFTELAHLLSGIVLAAIIIYFLGQEFWILFIFGNIGVFISGYIYTSKTFSTLFDNGIICEQME